MSLSTYAQRYATGDSNTAGAFAFDTVSSKDYAVSKLAWGDVGTVNHASATTPLPIDLYKGGTIVSNANPVPISDAAGSITVDGSVSITGSVTVASHAVTNSGTFSVQVDGNALTSLQLIDDPVFTDDAAFTPATSKVMMAGFEYDDTGTDSVDEGDAGAGRMSANRCQYVMLRDNAGNERGLNIDSSGNLTANITGTVTVGSHAVTNSGTFAVQAAQSGTWNVGTVTTVSTVTNVATIGTSVTPGTSAAHLGKAEDAASASGDTGVMVLAVRQATATDQSAGATDGDYEPLQVDANGRLHVISALAASQTLSTVTTVGTVTTITNVVHIDDNSGSITVDGTVTASIAAGATTIAKAEDVASADADVGVGCLAVRKGTPANTSGTDGDYEFLQMSAGRLWASVLVDTALPAGTNAIGKLASNTGVTIGAVEIASSQTLATVTTVTTVTTCSTVTTLTGSSIAHDGADSGNPHKVGAKATTSLSGKTMVADSDRSDLFSGTDGVLIIRPHSNLEDLASGVAAITDGSSTSVISAAGAGIKYYVTSVSIANTSASTVTVDIRDGTAGSVKWTFIAPAGGGVTHTFNPPLGGFTAATAMAADPSASASTVTVCISGFKSKI